MADLKISKKHSPTNSLAWRILSVSILLLVIPLFLQSLFLYRQEYIQKLNDTEEELTLLADERVHLISEVIELNRVLLNASPLEHVKQLYIEKIPMPQGVDDAFVLPSERRSALLVGKRDSNASALIVSIPFSTFGKEIPSAGQISLLDKKGNVLWENKKIASEDLLTVHKPVPGTELVLQLAVEKKQIAGLQLRTYCFYLATLIFFVGVLGGGAVYFLTKRVSRPLRNLQRAMQRVAEGATHARYTPDRMGFEINELGLQFNQTLDDLMRHSQEAERERLRREKLAEELRIGHEIQTNLLSAHLPELSGIDLAVGYVAAKEVNGDFYDVFRMEDGRLFIAVCDTAGKGISACLYSLGLRSILRTVVSFTSDLSQIVRRANDLYWADAHASAMFSTLWIGLFDPKTKGLIYCSQGHPPALLRRSGRIEELWTGGIALGAQKTDVIPTAQVSLFKGDLLLLYTDGILEAHDADNRLFGKKRLEEFVLRKKKESAQQIVDRLIEEVHLFSHGTMQHDDMTVVALKLSD